MSTILMLDWYAKLYAKHAYSIFERMNDLYTFKSHERSAPHFRLTKYFSTFSRVLQLILMYFRWSTQLSLWSSITPKYLIEVTNSSCCVSFGFRILCGVCCLHIIYSVFDDEKQSAVDQWFRNPNWDSDNAPLFSRNYRSLRATIFSISLLR